LHGSKEPAEVRRKDVEFSIITAAANTAIIVVLLHLVGASVAREFGQNVRVVLKAIRHDEYVVHTIARRFVGTLTNFKFEGVEGFPQSARMGTPAPSLKHRVHATGRLK